MPRKSNGAVQRDFGLRSLSLISLMLLAFMLPFELEKPLLQVGAIEITNVEVALGLVLGLGFALWIYKGRPSFRFPRSWVWLGVVFIGALLFSGLTAPVYRSNALTAVMRTASGMTLLLATTVIIRSKRDLTMVTAAILAGISVSTLIGLYEIASGDELEWLELFRSASTVSGSFIRLSGTFDYANQTAMFIEATLPLFIAFFLVSWFANRRHLALVFGFISLLLVQAAVTTYSRSAIGVILIIVLGLPIALWRSNRRHSQKSQPILLVLVAGALLIIFVNVLVDPVIRLRFGSESDIDWYLADIHAPAELTMISGQEIQLALTLTNNGAFVWESSGQEPVVLGARWVHPESEMEFADNVRWPLPVPIKPGETISMNVPVRAPMVSGEFRVIWDLVQESVTWFGAKTGRETSSLVIVEEGEPIFDDTGQSPLESGALKKELEYHAPIPGRFTLWKAAWNLWKDRPLQGIGLDNFRMRYGEVLGYSLWNNTIHSNSWYIETVVSVGVIGAIAFFLWLLMLAIDIIRRTAVGDVWVIAFGAALLAYLLHGLLDYFLLFNATGLLFWMLVGMWVSLVYQIEDSDERAV